MRSPAFEWGGGFLIRWGMNMQEPSRQSGAAAQRLEVIERSLLGLLDKILPEVECGRVSSLVVDDTSGRAIGLFLHRALDRLGHSLPILFVCPPGPDASGKRTEATLNPHGVSALGEHPLIVTEVIHSGEATGSIVRAINRVGKTPTIASLSGFLVPDDSEPWSIDWVLRRSGRPPPGAYSAILMPDELSYKAQELLCSDKVTAGVLREDAGSTRVLPIGVAYPAEDIRREVREFREELYRLAAQAANQRSG
jgi:hypothetical protein